MTNRFKLYLEQYYGLNNKMMNIKNSRKFAIAAAEMKSLLGKIKSFGKRHSVVVLEITYGSKGNPHTGKMYLTDIEEYEAVECVKYQLGDNLIDVKAFKLPLGQIIPT